MSIINNHREETKNCKNQTRPNRLKQRFKPIRKNNTRTNKAETIQITLTIGQPYLPDNQAKQKGEEQYQYNI